MVEAVVLVEDSVEEDLVDSAVVAAAEVAPAGDGKVITSITSDKN